MKATLLSCVFALAVSSPALAQSPSSPSSTMAEKPSSSPDATFMKKLAEGDLAEVDAGRLADERSANSSVKDFGREMVKDHSENGAKLKSLAASNGVQVPTTVGHRLAEEESKLQAASGSDFDSEYAKAMVRAHEMTAKLLQDEIDHGQVPEVKEFAEKTLPVVNHHLAMAKQLQAGLANSASRGGSGSER